MTHASLPICLLPGMTPHFPVYSKLLPLLPNARVVPFIEPKSDESLPSYAARMASRFPDPCFLGGVSFGGIVAQEIARVIRPAGCIVIASIRAPSQLPPWLRVCRMLGGRSVSRLLSSVGEFARHVPAPMRTSATMRLTQFSGTSGAWHRWATSALLDWTPRTLFDSPVLHIHGDADTTFPVRYTDPDLVIANGRHSLPLSHPSEVAEAIRRFAGAAER